MPVPHGLEHGVHGAAILEVAHQRDVEVVEVALRLVHAVEVEQRLRGVLVGSITGIDNGHRRELAGIARRALQVVAHDNQVGIVAHHHDGVFERLALRLAAGLGVAEANHAAAQAVDSRLKAEPGAGGRLKEERGHDLAVENLLVGIFLKLGRTLEQVHNLVLAQIGNRNQTFSFHILHLKIKIIGHKKKPTATPCRRLT